MEAFPGLACTGCALALALGTVGCGLIEGDEVPAGHVLTPEQEVEHNAPLGGTGCGQPDLERLETGAEVFVEAEIPEYPGRLTSTLDDCDNIVLSWGATDVVRVLASGKVDVHRRVAPGPDTLDPGFIFALATDEYGNIFGAGTEALLRITPSGEDFPPGLSLPYRVRFVKRDGDTFLVGGWNAYARLDIASGEFVWKSHGFEDDEREAPMMNAAPVDENSFLRAMYHADLEPPVWVERVTPSKPPHAAEDSKVEVVWSYHRPSSLSGIEVASAQESFAVGVSFSAPYEPCDSSLEWPSQGLIHKPPPCDEVQEVLFHRNGTMWSLWADREGDTLTLLVWPPDAEAPIEVAKGELPPPGRRATTVALRRDGAAIVSAFSSDGRGIRIVVVEAP